MTDFKKIILINLIILLIYSLIFHLSFWGDGYKALGILIFSAYAVGFQVLVNLVISIVHFVKKRKDSGKAYLGAAGIVLLVGLSACFGGAAIS